MCMVRRSNNTLSLEIKSTVNAEQSDNSGDSDSSVTNVKYSDSQKKKKIQNNRRSYSRNTLRLHLQFFGN